MLLKMLLISMKDLQGNPQLQDFLSHQGHQGAQQDQLHQCDQQVQSHHGYLSVPPYQGLRKVLVVQRYPKTKNNPIVVINYYGRGFFFKLV